jgi:hypothetical protein
VRAEDGPGHAVRLLEEFVARHRTKSAAAPVMANAPALAVDAARG